MTGMKKGIPKSSEALTGREDALDRIKTAMVEKKLTQAELADAADCHEKTIQNLLGGRSVRDQTLFDVCMVLGLDFPELRTPGTAKATRRRTSPEGAARRRRRRGTRSTWALIRAPRSTITSAVI